jgi:hypothetical protein
MVEENASKSKAIFHEQFLYPVELLRSRGDHKWLEYEIETLMLKPENLCGHEDQRFGKSNLSIHIPDELKCLPG